MPNCGTLSAKLTEGLFHHVAGVSRLWGCFRAPLLPLSWGARRVLRLFSFALRFSLLNLGLRKIFCCFFTAPSLELSAHVWYHDSTNHGEELPCISICNNCTLPSGRKRDMIYPNLMWSACAPPRRAGCTLARATFSARLSPARSKPFWTRACATMASWCAKVSIRKSSSARTARSTI